MNEFLDELPEGGRASHEHKPFAEQLRDEPGKYKAWPFPVKDVNSLSGIQSRIKRGILAAFRPAGAYDASVRKGILYVRYTLTEKAEN